ncbi:hypothetical protein KJ611_02445 [Patescibacteria group bacterium]|nr:hypothetical protein [Patescibacteria group bacterium]MBU1705904.1 hypothetical protein [Patescibacteria group bacterium]
MKSKPTLTPKQELATNQVTLKIYRRIAVGFVLVVAAILLIVIYISTTQATIRIQPVEETIKAEMILDIVKNPTLESEIRGRVVAGTIGKSADFAPSGLGKKEVTGVAKGEVTIYNKSGANQPLVKTTRLLTESGVLFRIENDVEVPAGGSVKVNAYADQAGHTGDIGPSQFTIPGLNEAKQKQIYAASTGEMKGGLAVVSVVSDQDIVNAAAQLKSELEAEAQTMLRDEVGDSYDGETFLTTIVDQTSTAAAGEESAAFAMAMTIKVVGVFYDRTALEEIATRKLYDSLTRGKEFARVNTEGLQSTIEKADVEDEMANVRVYLDGVTIPSATSTALDPGRFVGMNEGQVRQLLLSEGVAQNVQVDFFPFWVGSVPRLRDHVYIEIE